MSCRVEREFDAVDAERLVPVSSGDVRIEKSCAKNALALGGADVCPGAPPGVIAVGVRNQCAIYRKPGVYKEIARFAVESAVGGAEKVSHSVGQVAGFEPIPEAQVDDGCYNTYFLGQELNQG